MVKEKCLLIFNPYSGKGLIKNYLVDIVDIIVKSGYEVTIYPTQSSGDAVQQIINEAEKFDRIICSGGDGTLDEVVTGMMRSPVKVPIGYIPAGSTNDFGNSLGIDKDMLRAADIAFNGKEYKVDIGAFNEDSFVYVAAFGLFTEVSYSTSQDLKNVLGHAAYILEGAKQLRDIPKYRMQVEYDGNVFFDDFIFGMVTNSKSVGGFKGILPGNVELNDGLFEVTLVKNPRNPIELSEIIGALASDSNESELLYKFSTSKIKFTSSEDISWTLDGEFGGKMSVCEIVNRNNALEIMIES
jgi:YegS/Rv2252/BmrU family lipid kinase